MISPDDHRLDCTLINRLTEAVESLPLRPDEDTVSLWKRGLACELVSHVFTAAHII
jgi:hypothetical protein